MEEIRENKKPTIVYIKHEPEKKTKTEKQADLSALVKAIDERIAQGLDMLRQPKKQRINKVLTDEDGKKLTEETVLETEY